MTQLLWGGIKSGSFRRPSEQLLTISFSVPFWQRPSVGLSSVEVATVLTPKGLICRPVKSVALRGSDVRSGSEMAIPFLTGSVTMSPSAIGQNMGILSLLLGCWVKETGLSFCFAFGLCLLKSVLYTCSLEINTLVPFNNREHLSESII